MNRERASDELHAATPPGWYVGQPSYHDERREWLLYAFDPAERAEAGTRKREWQAVARAARRLTARLQAYAGNNDDSTKGETRGATVFQRGLDRQAGSGRRVCRRLAGVC